MLEIYHSGLEPLISFSSSFVLPAMPLGVTISGEIYEYVFVFSSIHRGSPLFFLLFLLLFSQLHLKGSPFFMRFLSMRLFFFQSNHRGSHIPSSWKVHAGCFPCQHSPL